MKPIVAIIGRPNVGKSTLFNRITKTRDAIVDNKPGVTRDRNFGSVLWNDVAFTVIDTGGIFCGDSDLFSSEISLQVEYAIANADVILVLLDGKNGLLPFDENVIQLLRQVDKPTLYVVNKIDTQKHEIIINDFYALGVEQFYSLSAEHGYGVPFFLDNLVETLPNSYLPEPEQKMIRIAVVGRPNAGKSSLINSIIGEDRLMVSDIPGTTRDAINSKIIFNGKTYLMVDTAGIRRKGKVREKIEKFSIIKALKRLDICDVALIVIDANQGINEQDIRIASYAHDRGCCVIFLINKWDLIDNKNGIVLKKFNEKLKENAKFISFAPMLTISALTGLRLNCIFELVDKLYSQYTTRVSTGRLNRIVQNAIRMNEPSFYKGKKLKFYYTTQVTSGPPTIVSFVNYPEVVHFSYKRYLLNKLRENTGLTQIPIKLSFRLRSGGNPVFLNKKTKTQLKKRKAYHNK